MAVTRASLIALYEEFTPADSTMVTNKIAAAEDFVDEDVWGDRYDFAVTLYACHLIAMGPYGMEMGLVVKNGETTYLRQYNDEAILSGSAWRMG